MEPHREDQSKAPPPGAERKPKRFRMVKLEDRIAPNKGGVGTNNGCVSGHSCYCSGTCGGGCTRY
jgi:hypothetical protein